MKIAWDKPDGSGWKVAKQKPPVNEVVDVWMRIAPSALSMGMSDEFGVPDAWWDGAKWRHMYRGAAAELDSSYVSHWRQRQPGALRFGPGWSAAPAHMVPA